MKVLCQASILDQNSQSTINYIQKKAGIYSTRKTLSRMGVKVLGPPWPGSRVATPKGIIAVHCKPRNSKWSDIKYCVVARNTHTFHVDGKFHSFAMFGVISSEKAATCWRLAPMPSAASAVQTMNWIMPVEFSDHVGRIAASLSPQRLATMSSWLGTKTRPTQVSGQPSLV